MYSERTGYYPYFGRVRRVAQRNMNALKRSMRNFRENTSLFAGVFPPGRKISACTAVIADLRWKLADLTRRLWGKSSEKRHLPEDAGQLSICFESPSDVNDPVAEEQKTAGNPSHRRMATIVSVKASRKKITPHARKPIDPSLPVRRLSFPCRKAFRWRERRSWERK